MTAPGKSSFLLPRMLIRDLTNTAMALTDTLWTPPNPIRALTVTAIHLSPEADTFEQADLFDPGAGSGAPDRKSWSPPWMPSEKNTAAAPLSSALFSLKRRKIPCHDPSGRKTAASLCD